MAARAADRRGGRRPRAVVSREAEVLGAHGPADPASAAACAALETAQRALRSVCEARGAPGVPRSRADGQLITPCDKHAQHDSVTVLHHP